LALAIGLAQISLRDFSCGWLRRGVVAALSSTEALLASDALISDLWSIVNSRVALI